MPCPECNKGRYPRPHGRCRAKIRREMADARVRFLSALVPNEVLMARVMNEMRGRVLYGVGIRPVPWSSAAAEWSESDDVAFEEWLKEE